MENLTNPTKVATKWALIYLITSIVITYAFQFLDIEQASPARYLAYIPFIAFLLLAQKEYKDQLGGYITFNQGFSTGFRYAVFGGLLMAVFIFVYLTFLSPEVLEKSLAESRAQMEAKGTSSADIEKGLDIGRKYGAIIGCFIAAIGITIFGTIVALVGAAIFKRERTAFDMENDTPVDPAV
jgi:hypothetical protein